MILWETKDGHSKKEGSPGKKGAEVAGGIVVLAGEIRKGGLSKNGIVDTKTLKWS